MRIAVKPERWQRVKELFEAALERRAEQRSAFLKQACGGDESLRDEVEGLIDSYEQDKSFLERPAVAGAAQSLLEDQTASLIGQSIGPYKIVGEIGRGGMGEVYLAQDSRLGRQVALKLLPALFTTDQDRLRRFKQEARAASALSHPNICVIYEVGETEDGRHYMAMEYVDGVTLRKHMRETRMEMDEVLDITMQAAAALTAAHAAGVVHRDIKPENIMLRQDGYIKVLDFGLAKLTETATLSANSEAPTAVRLSTEAGVVMGTPHYMSPEQARGLVVDSRTDIWSLGVVLYEMVTGTVPFKGATNSDVIVSILEREPPSLTQISPGTPDGLQRIVTKALRKDKEERYQTAKDLAIDLRHLKQRLELDRELERSRPPGVEEETIVKDEVEVEQASEQKAVTANAIASHSAALMAHAPETTPQNQATVRTESGFRRLQLGAQRYKRRYFFAIGGLVLIFAGFGLARLIQNQRPATAPGMRDQAITFKRLTYDSNSSTPAISADGKHLAYTVRDKDGFSIWLKNLANGSAVRVMAPAAKNYWDLAFSPDDNQLYYTTSRTGVVGYVLCRVPVFGGTPQDVVKDAGGNFALSSDGKQVAFIRESIDGDFHLIIANVDGSGERDSADLGLMTWVSEPAWSPDGQKLAVGGAKKDQSGWRAVLREVQISDGAIREIPTPHWWVIHEVAWLSDNSGFIVTAGEKEDAPAQIWQVAAEGGEARRLTNDGNVYYHIGLTGDSHTLVACQMIFQNNIWIAPDGDARRARQLTSGTNSADGGQGLYWTPDNKLVFVSSIDGELDLWMMDADGSNRKQLTTKTGGSNVSPRVTPDGRYIVFASNRTGQYGIWRMDADGNNQRQLSDGESAVSPALSPDDRWESAVSPALSPDGRWVYYTMFSRGLPPSLRKVSIDGGPSVRVPAKYYFDRPAVSPDGKLLVYQYQNNKDRTVGLAITSVEGGEPLKLFESLPAARGIARFTPDSRAIIYINNGITVGNIWRQPLDGSPPQPFTNFTEGYIGNFALSADGHQLALARSRSYSDVVLITDFR